MSDEYVISTKINPMASKRWKGFTLFDLSAMSMYVTIKKIIEHIGQNTTK